MPYQCDRCSRAFEEDVAVALGLRCVTCGGTLLLRDTTATAEETSPILGAIDLRHWPHVLALPLAEYAREAAPFLKLHRLTEAAETLTRFCAVVALSNLLDMDPLGGFPDPVRENLRDKLARPTFGAWRDMLDAAVAALPRRGSRRRATPADLSEFVRSKLLPLLGSGNTPPDRGVIALRNALAHRGRLTPDELRHYLEQHPPRFQALLEGATLFSRLQVVGSPEAGRGVLLHGVPAAGMAFPSFDLTQLAPGTEPPRPDRLLLVDEGQVTDLFPLHAYADVFHYVDKGREETRATGLDPARDSRVFFERLTEASPAAQLYFRRGDKDYLEYTAFSPAASHSQEGFAALERFKQVFRLEEWRRQADARAARSEFNFSDWYKELLELFVGRGEQVREVVKALNGSKGGLCWLHGHPGVGKSAFVAKIARDHFNDPRQVCKVVHIFRTTDPRCGRMKFLENALTQLGSAFGQAEPPAADPRDREDQFVRLLSKLTEADAEGEADADAEASAGRASRQPRRILFLLDGLDEVGQLDRGFPDLVFRNTLPGVTWLCSGREEFGLGERFRQARAFLPFGETGLPGLTEDDVREVLDRECGRQIYEFYMRDRPDGLPGAVANPFLAELVQRSGGLPLYLRLLIQDLREGRLSFREGAEKQLPLGLSSYYERVLERLQVSDVAAVLTPVFGLLAVAKAPLTFDTIRRLMARDRLVGRPGGPDLLRRVLEFGHLMLRRVDVAEPPGGGDHGGDARTETGYILYHESFREHLVRSKTVEESVGAAADDFCRLAAAWSEQRDHLHTFRYALRFGPRHLLDERRFPAHTEILTALPFLEAKAEAGMVYDLIDDLLTGEGPAGSVGAPRAFLGLLGESVRRHGPDIARNPATLFQNLWNDGWWYDAPAAAVHVETPPEGWPPEGPPWDRPAPKLHHLLESWRDARPSQAPGSGWLRALRPPTIGLGAPGRVILSGHTWGVRSVAFEPSGGRAATYGASGDDTVRLWDLRTGRELRRFVHPRLAHLQFTSAGPRGTEIVDGKVVVWDLEADIPLFSTPPSTVGIHQTLLSPDGRFLAVAAWEEAGAHLSGGKLAEPRYFEAVNEIILVEFLRQGGKAIPVGRGVTVQVWSVDADQMLQEWRARDAVIDVMAFDREGQRLALGLSNGLAYVWDLTGDDPREMSAAEDRFREIMFTPDGQGVLAHTEAGLMVWQAATGSGPYSMVPPLPRSFQCLTDAEGCLILIGPEGGDESAEAVVVLNVSEEQMTRFAEPGLSVYLGIFMSADGRWLAAKTKDADLRVWDLHDHRVALRTASGGLEFAFSPDGDLLATAAGEREGKSASDDPTIGLWEAETGAPVGRLTGHRRPVDTLHFSPDGTRLISHSGSLIKVWDVAARSVVGEQRVDGTPAPRFDDRGRAWLDGIDGDVRLWVADDPLGPAHILIGAGATVRAVAFQPGGPVVASAYGDGSVLLWDTGTGSRLHHLEGHEGPVECLAFSPDGTRLVTGGDDRSVRVWDVASGRGVTPAMHHDDAVIRRPLAPEYADMLKEMGRMPVDQRVGGAVKDVAFSLDGQLVISCSYDETVRVWDAETGFEQACLRLDAPGSEVFAPEFNVALARFIDNDSVITYSGDRWAGWVYRIWDRRSGSVARTKKIPRSGHLLALSPDGELVLFVSDRTILVCDSMLFFKPDDFEVSFAPSGAEFTPDSRRLAIWSRDGDGVVWDRDQKQFTDTFRITQGPVEAVGVGTTGLLFASASRQPVIVCLDLVTGNRIRFQQQWDRIQCFALAPGGAYFATVARDTVRLHDIESGRAARKVSCADVASVGFTASGDRLILGRREGEPPLVWSFDRSTDQTLRAAEETGAVLAPDPITIGAGIDVRPGDELYLFRAVDRGQVVAYLDADRDGSLRSARPPLYRVPFHKSGGWIEEYPTGAVIAHFPGGVSRVAVHPSGRLWAVGRDSDWELYELESPPEVERIGSP